MFNFLTFIFRLIVGTWLFSVPVAIFRPDVRGVEVITFAAIASTITALIFSRFDHIDEQLKKLRGDSPED